jgi:DNA-directed RNA polymerase sigma subunit (sigma70/sigma32)
LASVCGVSHQAIHSIEMQALRKLRAKLSREAPEIFGMLSRI